MTIGYVMLFLLTVVTNLLHSIHKKEAPHFSCSTNTDKALALISWLITVLLGAGAIGSVLRYPVLLESLKATHQTQYAEVRSHDRGYVSLDGEIGKTSTESFKQLLSQGHTHTLILNSNGGLIDEAKKIAKLVKQNNIDIFVTRECFSACVLVAISGQHLNARPNAKFGFHQASIMGDYQSNITQYWANVATRELFHDLRQGGIPETVLTAAKETRHDNMHYVTAAELKELGMNVSLIRGNDRSGSP